MDIDMDIDINMDRYTIHTFKDDRIYVCYT